MGKEREGGRKGEKKGGRGKGRESGKGRGGGGRESGESRALIDRQTWRQRWGEAYDNIDKDGVTMAWAMKLQRAIIEEEVRTDPSVGSHPDFGLLTSDL